jgi:hypothetical protein
MRHMPQPLEARPAQRMLRLHRTCRTWSAESETFFPTKHTMTGTQRFRQYLKFIPQHERESWIFATLGNMDDEIASLKKEIAKLKSHNTRLKNKKP